MKETFRASMLWLHGWLGITAGWLLFFVFLTGTTAFVHLEISRWMRPELPLVSNTPPAAETLVVAERFLAARAPRSEFWGIFFPAHRGNDELTVTWREPRGQIKRAILDLETGQPVERHPRLTGGGFPLYVMHYALHYLSRDVAILIVGAAAMMMLISILTGLISQRNLFKGLFKLRAGPGAASWRSRHLLIGVTALPFFLVMTWSGLLLFLFVYMPTAKSALFPDDDAVMRFNVEAFFPPDRPYELSAMETPPSITDASEVLRRAEALWGEGAVFSLRVENPGSANVRVSAYTRRAGVLESRTAFDAVTGAPIPMTPPRTATARFLETMVGLHKAHFAGPLLKGLYLLCGLAGAALVATGLMHWSAKRAAKPGSSRVIAVVDRITLGVVIGLPIGLAAYFWANRLLPAGMAGRAGWEVHTLFILWSAALLYAALRPRNRAGLEMCAFAAAAFGLLPVLNALTTARHLGVTIPAGDWSLAGFDLFFLAAGAFFAALAHKQRRAETNAGRAASLSKPVTV